MEACSSNLVEKHAELRCQINVARSNLNYLGESIVQLSQEVENALLRDKWASCPKARNRDGKVQCPIEDSLTIYKELSSTPESIGDVLRMLEQKQSSLQNHIATMTKALEDLQGT